MAKAPTKPAPTFEPESTYAVTLARPIVVGRTTILPMHGLELKGKIVEEHMADILDAVKIA